MSKTEKKQVEEHIKKITPKIKIQSKDEKICDEFYENMKHKDRLGRIG